MRVLRRKPATYLDIEALPENMVGEIVDGELWASPRPATPHAHTASILGMDLGGPFQRGRGGPGGWWILDEPELHFGQDVLVPDLAGWRRERMPQVPRGPFLTLAPDWVCEVMSPGTASLDRVKKMRVYSRERVAHVWLVDPVERTLEIYRLTSEGYLEVAAHSGQERVRAEPFDAVELDLGALWLADSAPEPSP